MKQIIILGTQVWFINWLLTQRWNPSILLRDEITSTAARYEQGIAARPGLKGDATRAVELGGSIQ